MRGLVHLLIVAGCLSSAGSALSDEGRDDSQRIARRSADGAPRANSSAKRSGTAASGWTTVTGALTVVIVLILALAKGVRRRGLLAPASLPGEAIEVLGHKLVDYRHTIHLVRCGSRLLVLGASHGGLTTLAEIDDPAEVESLVNLCGGSEHPSLTLRFGDWLRQRQPKEKTESANAAPADSGPAPSVLRLRERLAAVERHGLQARSDDSPSAREETG